MQILDQTVKQILSERLGSLEANLEGDVAFFYGPIDVSYLRIFRDFIERMTAASNAGRSRLVFFLNTPGGSAEAVEKMVEIIRHHYAEVFVIVPDFALSVPISASA